MEILSKKSLLDLKMLHSDNKIIKNLLSTIIGELDRITKNPTEDQIMKVIKKLYESNKECMKDSSDESLKIESDFLFQFIPKELSDEEIKNIVNSEDLPNIGAYMKYFKETYPNQYNGSKVKGIVTEYLKNK